MANVIKPESYFSLRSKILTPSLTSQYICYFSLPKGGSSYFSARGLSSTGKLYDRLSLACCDATLPGSSLATHEINNDFTGVTERHAYRRLYDERSDFSFYVDASEHYVIKFFESWLGYTVAEQYTKDPTYSYRANFPDDYYANSLSITKFEKDFQLGENYSGLLRTIPKKDNKKYFTYDFINAYPINIASMPVSYEASQLLKCTVAFTYSRYILSK